MKIRNWTGYRLDGVKVVHDEGFALAQPPADGTTNTDNPSRWGDRAKVMITPIGSKIHIETPHPEDPFLVGRQHPPELPANVEAWLLLANVQREWHTAGYWILEHRGWKWGFYHADSAERWHTMLKRFRFSEKIPNEFAVTVNNV